MALVNLLVIVLSIASFCIETMSFAANSPKVFKVLEYFYCTFFTVDFVIRLCCCPNVCKFFRGPMTWIDLLSITQFYINFFANSKVLDFLFVLRLVRIFRLFRFFKNLSGMQVIGQTLKASARELFLLVLIVLIPMVIFSTLAYFAEQQETLKTFESIPETFWWAIITMTTVGYGDVTPKSAAGKVVGALCACSGVLILALPVSVIGSNFTLYYSYAQARLRLPKRKQPALVMADKALVNAKIEQRETEQSLNGSEMSDDDKKTPRSRRQAISVTSSGISGSSTPRFGKKSGMVSSGLSGLAAVMVEMTVPGQRRMALTPVTCPITDQHETKSMISKSITTSSSDVRRGETIKEYVPKEKKEKKSKYSFFDPRKPWRKSLTDNSIIEIDKNRQASSPNLRMMDDRRESDVMRTRLAPQDALATMVQEGITFTPCFDKHGQCSDKDSAKSLDVLPTKNGKKFRRKKEPASAKMSMSDRNIPLRVRNGNASSPLLARIVKRNRSKSNKNLQISTDSLHSGKLTSKLQAEGHEEEKNMLLSPRRNSSINIFITEDTDEDCNDNELKNEKLINNGRNDNCRGETQRSISLMHTPIKDYNFY